MSVALLERVASSPTVPARRPALDTRARLLTTEVPAPRTRYARRSGERLNRTDVSSAKIGERIGTRRETSTYYGPNLLPLFYTAHRIAPGCLEWETPSPHHVSRLSFGLHTEGADFSPLFTRTLPAGVRSYSLRDIEWKPGAVYAWRVETSDAPTESPVQEGRFWLLDNMQQARWKLGCRALAEEGGDRDFAALALSLFLAELELYQDALELIKHGPARAERASHVLLAHTAQALVYRQMQKNLDMARQNEMQDRTPWEAFFTWAARRERYHCDRASAQMEAARAEMPAADALPTTWEGRSLLGCLRAM